MKPPSQNPSSVPSDSASEISFLERVMRYQDGTLRGSELAVFEAELREDPHKLKLFADVQMQSVMTRECMRNAAFAIHEESDATSESDTPRISVASLEQTAKPSRRTRNRGQAIVPLAILAIIGLAVFGIARLRQPVQTTADRGVALLTQHADIEWLDSLESRRPGSVLEPGWLRLKSGAALIEFYSGARMVLEGPAELQLVSANEGYLKSGRMSAHVPEVASGFKVRTDRFDVIDRGTEFGLAIDRDATGEAQTEVHVFDGLVEVQSADSAVRELKTGDAVRSDHKVFVELASDRTAFLQEEELQRRAAVAAQARFEAWQTARREFVAQPAVIWHESMMSAALEQGSLVGCDWTGGRWSQKSALLFRRPADRVRLQLEDPIQQVTLLAWVRIDSLSPGMTALMTVQQEQIGALNWLVTDRGQLRLEIGRDLGRQKLDWEAVNSQAVLTSDRCGEWLLLATTFDGNTIRHFLNGQPCGSGASFRPPSLRIGLAELGNGNAPAMRHLFGAIDEFSIVARAMSPAELAAYFEKGRP